MNATTMNDIHSPPPSNNPLTWALVIGLLLWTLFVTMTVHGVTLFLAWSTDLSKLFADAQTFLSYGLLQPVLIALPALLLLLLRDPRQRAAVRTLLLVSLAAGFLILPRVLLAPEAVYLAGWARAGVSAALGLALLGRASTRGVVRFRPRSGLGLAALIGFLFLLPWLAYGAFGDGFDVLTALLQALGLALLTAGLAADLMPVLHASSENRTANVWLGGVTLAIGLAAVAGAWGQMDYQALLIGVLPGLAFPLALFGIETRRYDVWPALLVVAVATFGPLALADPRETRLALLLFQENAVWTFRAAAVNFIVGWIVLWVVGLFNTRLLTGSLARHWGKLAALVAVACVLVFTFWGQPGLHGDRFILVLDQQADLSPAYEIEDVGARRAWVYDVLVAQAEATQPDLLSWLEARDIPYTRYYLVNAVEVQANVLRRWQLAQRPDVARTLYSPRLRPVPRPAPLEPGDSARSEEIPWGIEAIGAPRVWSELGVTGEGITVGSSDSGVDASHPLLAEGYRGRDAGDDYNWFDPWRHSSAPNDGNGHGTHTMGTAIGRDGVGVAPGATWFACANLVRATANAAFYLDCMQFMLAPHPQQGDPLHDGRPDLAADVSSNSWGCPASLEGCDQLTLWQAAEALRTAGIFFVVAAGNEGPACNSLETPPGNYDNVFAVGAIDAAGDITSFSSRGPETGSPDGNDSPELLAPGLDVTSAWPGHAWRTIPGTSMATPHVAGTVALMWSANPTLRGDVDATRQILIETAKPYTGQPDGCGDLDEFPDSGAGYGVLDAYAAVKRALAWP